MPPKTQPRTAPRAEASHADSGFPNATRRPGSGPALGIAKRERTVETGLRACGHLAALVRRRIGLWLIAAIPVFAAPPPAETLALRGTVTNTTHEITAPAQLELVVAGDKITGFLTIEEPLHAGRWPITGTRRGAWYELICVPQENTQLNLRGVLGAARYRGTYSFTGDTVQTQYGQFDLTPPPTP